MWKERLNTGIAYMATNGMQKKDMLQEAEVAVVNPEAIFTDMAPVWNLNIQTIKPSELDLLTPFKLRVKKKGA